MANILNMVTVGEKAILIVDAAPGAASGTPATLGTIAVYDDGTTAIAYIKSSNLDTGWDQINTSAISGLVNPGVAGRVALYPVSSNQVDDIYVQNSQNIDINVVAQPTRSAPIEYTVPNPGDAVTAASFVLTEGAQTINGAKTFGNDVVVQGNFTVNGSLTYLHTTNTTVSDALLTLNKGGAASSAGGAGIEFEENAAITAYMKINSGSTGFIFKAPTTFELANVLSGLTANRTITYLDLSGYNAVQSPSSLTTGSVIFASAGLLNQDNANFFWDSTNHRLGIGNAAPTVALHVTGSARITGLSTAGVVHNDANGNLSTSAVSLTTDVSGILPLANGGTNASLTAVAGGIVYSGASAMAISSAGSAGQALLSGGTTAPTWFSATGVVKATAGVLSTSNVSLTSEVTGILPIANGGTNSSTTLNNNRIMVSLAGSIVEAAALTNGQLLIGSTGAAPVAAAISGTTNQVIVTNGAGSITLSLPQNIHTAATPTFAGLTLSGAGATFDLNDTTAGMDAKQSMYTVNTTDATVTTIATIATATDTVTLIEVKITGRRTGGTAGTAGDSATYIRTARVKNVGGTVSIVNLQSDYTSEDQLGFNGTISISGTNILAQVQGAANNNMQWKALVTKIV